MGHNLFPHTDNCTLKVEDKRKTLLVSMAMSYSKCRHCMPWCLCGSWGNNSNVDYRIYKYKFRVLQSNLIILFASHTWSCYKSVFQSIQHRGGSVSILAFYMQFTVKWRIFVQHKCNVISLSGKILVLYQHKGQKSVITRHEGCVRIHMPPVGKCQRDQWATEFKCQAIWRQRGGETVQTSFTLH